MSGGWYITHLYDRISSLRMEVMYVSLFIHSLGRTENKTNLVLNAKCTFA